MKEQENLKPDTREWAELLDPQSLSYVWNWMVSNIDEMRDKDKIFPLDEYNLAREFDDAWDFFSRVDWQAGFYGDREYFVMDECGLCHSIEEIDPEDYETFLRIASDPNNYEALEKLQKEVGNIWLGIYGVNNQ